MLQSGRFSYTRQQQPLGLGHAVWCARDLVGDEPFAVLLVDDLIIGRTPALGQLIDASEKTGGNMVAVMEVQPAETARYGVIDPGERDGALTEVKGLVEKPTPAEAPSNLAVIGRYVFQPEIFHHLAAHEPGAGGEIQLTDAMAKMIGGKPFHGLTFEGERFDCGDKLGFLQANVALGLRHDGFRDGLIDYIRRHLEPEIS